MVIKMAKRRFNKTKYILAIVVTAVVLVLATLLTVWLMGYRMIRYETDEHGVIRFVGKINKENEEP